MTLLLYRIGFMELGIVMSNILFSLLIKIKLFTLLAGPLFSLILSLNCKGIIWSIVSQLLGWLLEVARLGMMGLWRLLNLLMLTAYVKRCQQSEYGTQRP